MTKKPFIQIDIRDNPERIYRTGDQMNADIILWPWIDMEIYELRCRLVHVVTGNLRQSAAVARSEKVADSRVLYKDEKYRFKFSTSIPYLESYRGRNAEFVWKLEAFVVLVESSKRDVQQKAVRNLDFKKLLNLNKQLEAFEYFEVQAHSHRYDIREKKMPMSVRWNYFLWPSLLMMVLLSIFLYEAPHVLGGFGLFFLFITIGQFIFYRHCQRLLNSLAIAIHTVEEEKMKMDVSVLRNRQDIKEIGIQYIIREEVTNNEGEDAKVYDTQIFHTKEQTIKPVANENQVFFDLPDNGLPGTYLQNDLRIYWQLLLRVKSRMGITFHSECDIIVKKVVDLRGNQ